MKKLNSNQPKRPKIFRSIYNDITIEALKSSLANNFPSGGILSNEAGIVFGGHTMNPESIMRTLGTLNQLWDGNDIRTDRQTSESSIVRNARLTVSLQVQKDPLKRFNESSNNLARGIGLFARFLIAWPKSTQGTRNYQEPPDNWPGLDAFNNRILEILSSEIKFDDLGGVSPKTINFSPEAKKAWIEFHDHIERSLGMSGRFHEIQDVASKIADNAVRIAALFHVFEFGTDGHIELETFNKASAIAYWHLHEAKRFFKTLALSKEDQAMIKLNGWLINQCQETGKKMVERRYTLQYGPNSIRKKEFLNAALEKLESLKRIRQNGKIVFVNPTLL